MYNKAKFALLETTIETNNLVGKGEDKIRKQMIFSISRQDANLIHVTFTGKPQQTNAISVCR